MSNYSDFYSIYTSYQLFSFKITLKKVEKNVVKTEYYSIYCKKNRKPSVFWPEIKRKMIKHTKIATLTFTLNKNEYGISFEES